jgi:hypothetical protein
MGEVMKWIVFKIVNREVSPMSFITEKKDLWDEIFDSEEKASKRAKELTIRNGNQHGVTLM